jgi:hypothetical protein
VYVVNVVRESAMNMERGPGMARSMCAGYQEYLVSRNSAVVRVMVTVDQQAWYCADSCFAPTIENVENSFFPLSVADGFSGV